MTNETKQNNAETWNNNENPNAQKMVLWHPSPAKSRLELTLPFDAGIEVVAETLTSLSYSGWVLVNTYTVFVEEGRWA